MTPDQVKWAVKLGACSMTPTSAQKRFARSMSALAKANPAAVLTEKQASYLEFLVHRYRRQNGFTGPKPPDLGRETLDLRNVASP